MSTTWNRLKWTLQIHSSWDCVKGNATHCLRSSSFWGMSRYQIGLRPLGDLGPFQVTHARKHTGIFWGAFEVKNTFENRGSPLTFCLVTQQQSHLTSQLCRGCSVQTIFYVVSDLALPQISKFRSVNTALQPLKYFLVWFLGEINVFFPFYISFPIVF